jgi:uncharacterized protein YdhG (YjbR/CyaY superfamily)
MISCQIPTFKLNDKNLVHLAAFKNHVGFIRQTTSDIEALKRELTQYNGAKDSVQFPYNKPIPYDSVENCYIASKEDFKEVREYVT